MAEEKRLQTKILNDLRSRSEVCAFKIIQCSDSGCPDLFFTSLITGAVFVEVKAEGKKPGLLQTAFNSKLNMCGCKAYCVDTWESWVKLRQGLFLQKI